MLPGIRQGPVELHIQPVDPHRGVLQLPDPVDQQGVFHVLGHVDVELLVGLQQLERHRVIIQRRLVGRVFIHARNGVGIHLGRRHGENLRLQHLPHGEVLFHIQQGQGRNAGNPGRDREQELLGGQLLHDVAGRGPADVEHLGENVLADLLTGRELLGHDGVHDDVIG